MQIDWLKTCRLHVYYKRRMCKEKTIKRAGKICRGIFIINSYRLKRGGKRIGCDIHTALLRTHAHFCFYFKGGYIYIYIFPSFCFFQAGCRSLKNGRDTRKALLTLDCVDFLIPYAHNMTNRQPLKNSWGNQKYMTWRKMDVSALRFPMTEIFENKKTKNGRKKWSRCWLYGTGLNYLQNGYPLSLSLIFSSLSRTIFNRKLRN